MKTKLTRSFVAGLRAGPKMATHYDTAIPGFGVRVMTTGKRTYFLNVRIGRGKGISPTNLLIGSADLIGIDEARGIAREWLVRAKRGEDPRLDADPASRGITVAELADIYSERYVKVRLKPGSARSVGYWLDDIKAQIGRVRLKDLNVGHVDGMMAALKDRKTTANQCLATLSAMLNKAELWRLREPGSPPTRHVKAYDLDGRDGSLKDEELVRLGEALSHFAERFPQTVWLARLLLFTGARRGEMQGLKWDWVDFDRRTARLPDSKTGAKTVYLNDLAMEVLRSIPRQRHSPYVFPGLFDGHIQSPKDSWNRIRRHAGLPRLRMHDLRHVFASIGVSTGGSIQVTGKLLGHSRVSTTERYAHLAAAPLLAESDRVGRELAARVNRKDADAFEPPSFRMVLGQPANENQRMTKPA